jgi:signal transduction histidine kinase/ligand-binding sensor domain-containing protein/DNA-binding response OmpR family regulator
LGIEDGLSQVTINDIYQDELGMMWFGTRDGLNRYNGNEITVFKPVPNDNTSLSHSSVKRITGDGNGNLYLQTSGNIILFDLKKESFKELFPESNAVICPGKKGLRIFSKNTLYLYDSRADQIKPYHTFQQQLAYVTSLCETSDSVCWIGTSDGLYAIDTNLTVHTHLPGSVIKDIYEDRNRNIWICTSDKGLFKYQRNGDFINYRHDPDDKNSLVNDHVRTVCEDNTGNLWIGSPFGLSCFRKQKNEFQTYPVPSENSLNSQSVTRLYKDRQGTVWIGTYFRGIKYLNPETEPFSYYYPREGGLPYSIVGKFSEDRDGMIWICTEGGGIASFDPRTEKFESFKLRGNNFKSIVYDPKEHCLWLGTHISFLVRFDIAAKTSKVYDGYEKKFGETIRALCLYKEKILIGSASGISLFDPSTEETVPFIEKTVHYQVTAMMIDSGQRLWIGSAINGLDCLDPTTMKLSHYKHRKDDPGSISSNNINVIFEDHKQQIWIGTNGFGLNLYKPERDHFTRYTKSDNGLVDNNIIALSETKTGNLLIGTGSGLSSYSFHNGQVKNCQHKNGFPLITINENSLFVSSAGMIYIGGVTGMILLKEENLNSVSKASSLQFTKLYVNNHEVKQGDNTGILDYTLSYTDKIRINPTFSVFSIEFATDNYLTSDPEDVEYRLNGYESQWMNVKFGRILTYTNLNPGNYTLKLRLKSAPEITKSLTIIIPPPFYKSPAAYILYILVFTGLLYWIIRQARMRFYLKTSLEFEKREKEKNEELTQSKLRFFTNISHEIRTPITLIMGQTDHLLQSHRIHPSIYSKILNIHENASSLNRLISELLDFRKQELGHLKLKIAQINFIDFLKETHIIFNDYAINRNISFDFHAAVNKIPLWIDTGQMQKVINNLLSNAFKFTPEGGRITLSVEENDSEITFSVKDTGKGIPPDKIRFIFDRFYQTGKNDNTTGTGIGLALSKGIVTAHAGRIRVESETGKGSVFTVTLKKGDAHFAPDIIRIENRIEPCIHELKNPDNSFVEEVKKSQQKAGSEQSTLLIVEDNKEVREFLREIFSPVYKTEVAADGPEGLEKVRNLQPDIVISDIMMPGMSGMELCEKIKNNLETCHIPVILLTAKTAIEHKLQGWRTGADDYITKPFDLKLLIIRCNNLVNSRKLLQKKYIHQTDTSTQQVATTAIDKNFIDRATETVEKNMNSPDFNMDLFARRLGLGRTTLFNKLRGITGLTPNSFITNIRLKKAANLLLNNPEMNISEIAYSTGFGSPGYFNKCFKNLFGYTPVDFRKRNKNSASG